ncbi:Site-specific DNA methylase [Sporocytophaga myxococcoides]|uniref:DNA (cytosine-5-)-methyltransferase n=1 Tax=Sporocytophaga myxococcoides TaxID=153721 RepID=A0A098L993_9BACT|nr:DNA cytosine methyltransferase [Sporocytophaga myxococcoides]GAL83455.1 Site-specific DNA methylase [Sporocytophaga myxococcoides]
MNLYFIDLFCGAGGVTTGILRAKFKGKSIAKVIACVNHDPLAIKSHSANHKGIHHFIENIRTLDLSALVALVATIRKKDPNAKICLWASAECTNYSKAKGGLPRDADSRTLPNHLFRYIEALNPDYFWMENVEEFMAWGPLDENGKPLSRKNGRDYLRWVEIVKSYGYEYDYRILNCADYGAYTSRKRYFAQFAKSGLPISWPAATHSKNPSIDLFSNLQKWKPVKDCLDFKDEGKSIFREKPLSTKSYERIYAGLIKYVAGGYEDFLAKYYSGKPEGKVIPTSGPAGTIKTSDAHSYVKISFLKKYLGNDSKSGINNGKSVEEPCPVITCQNRLAIVQTKFLAKYYSNGGELSSVGQVCSTLTTKDRISLVQPKFWLDKNFSGRYNHQSIDSPAGAILTNDKHCLMTSQYFINKHYSGMHNHQNINQPSGSILTKDKYSLVKCISGEKYLLNPAWGGHSTGIESPCPTIVARQDKAPLYYVSVEKGIIAIPVFETDSEIVRKIKEFMALYGIVDIKMRMLKVPELLKIQGFPQEYILKGNQTDQKKFIGNSVPPPMVQALIERSYSAISEMVLKEAV